MLKHHFTKTEDGTLTGGWWAGHYGEQLCTWIWDAEARILRVRCGDITRPKSLAEFNPEWLTDDELRKRIPPLALSIAESIRGKPFEE